MTFICEIGSGNSIPHFDAGKRLVDAIAEQDTGKHDLVFKAQLWCGAIPPNEPLNWDTFDYLYGYCKSLKYELTASVFDSESLRYLRGFDPAFVKIACRPELYYLIDDVPRSIPVYVSVKAGTSGPDYPRIKDDVTMMCVPEYPAEIADYFGHENWRGGISDHTRGWKLYDKCKDRVKAWEKHVVYERDAKNPDAGPFSVTPDELQGVL